jgi:hypothetical protein
MLEIGEVPMKRRQFLAGAAAMAKPAARAAHRP